MKTNKIVSLVYYNSKMLALCSNLVFYRVLNHYQALFLVLIGQVLSRDLVPAKGV